MQDDLAARLGPDTVQHLMGGAGLRQRQYGPDRCDKASCLHHPRNGLESLGRDVYQEEGGFDAARGSERLIRLGYSGNQSPAGLQHSKGPRLHVAADQVDHGVNVVDQGLEWGAFAREHLLGAETADERQVLLRACCHHPDACLPGELDRERTNIAGRSVDQHALSAERGRLLEQRLPGGDCDDRNGRGVDV